MEGNEKLRDLPPPQPESDVCVGLDLVRQMRFRGAGGGPAVGDGEVEPEPRGVREGVERLMLRAIIQRVCAAMPASARGS